jgi:integrase
MWQSYMGELNRVHGVAPRGKRSKFDPAGTPITIDVFTPHQLRHTYATMLYSAGVDVLTAREQIGHADVQTTLGIYTHLSREHKQKNMAKLDDFLSDGRNSVVNSESDDENSL